MDKDCTSTDEEKLLRSVIKGAECIKTVPEAKCWSFTLKVCDVWLQHEFFCADEILFATFVAVADKLTVFNFPQQ